MTTTSLLPELEDSEIESIFDLCTTTTTTEIHWEQQQTPPTQTTQTETLEKRIEDLEREVRILKMMNRKSAVIVMRNSIKESSSKRTKLLNKSWTPSSTPSSEKNNQLYIQNSIKFYFK